MADREEAYLLRGKIQINDSYLGGKLPGGKAGRGRVPLRGVKPEARMP
jgi:hypothetical protein